MSDQYRNFMGNLWVLHEENVYTIGVNEDGLDEITEIESIELPQENELVEADGIIGSIETGDGPLDIYTPVSGKVIEVNTAVAEDPSIIMEDPYDAWLVKIESNESPDDEDDDEEESDEEEEEEEELAGRD